MRGVDHTEENCESGLLDIGGVLDTVDGGRPINTQAPHLVRLHDRVRSVEPSVGDEREEEESGLAKLEWLVVLEHVTDTANERRLGRIEELESLDGGGTGSVGQRAQSILDWLVLVLATPGSQVEMMIQEGENVSRFLDPWQELVPLVGSVHGQTRGERGLSLHDDVEQLIALLGDFVLREGGDQLHGFQSPVDLFGRRSGVTERLGELLVDPRDLKAAFVTAKKRVI